MRKLLLTIVSVFAITSVCTSFVLAQADPLATPAYGISTSTGSSGMPIQTSAQTFLGQDQYYTVTFRGNGEAVVALKVIFSNLTNEPISTVTLRSPKADIQDVLGFQVMRDSQCLRYAPMQPTPDIQSKLQQVEQSVQTMMYPKPSICEEYQAPDYYQYWYGVTKYQKATVEVKGDSVIVGLPSTVQPNMSASFMLYYRASGFTSKNIFGAYSFTFETMKAEDQVRTLQVGISTDSDLVLRGAKGTVDYIKPSITAMDMGAAKAIPNSQLDSTYQQIGQGTIIKTASNLQPLESYKVKGSYAASTASLYGTEIFWAVVVVILVLALLVFLVRKLILRMRAQSLNKMPKALADKEQGTGVDSLRIFLEVTISSFIASILVSAYTIVLIIGVTQLNMYYYSYSQLGLVFVIFLSIISIAVYSLFMFAPAIYLGVKRGYWWGLVTFILTIFFLLVYVVVFAGLSFVFRSGQSMPYPTQMYNQAAPSKT